VRICVADGARSDGDGDGIPDGDDRLPALATVPLHWSVESLTLRLPGDGGGSRAWNTTNELTLFSARARGDVPGSRAGACATASPLDRPGARAQQGYGIRQLGLFGSGICTWDRPQRLGAEAFLARRPDPVEIVLEIHFRNLSDTDWVIKELSVPILAGGRKLALARPAQQALFERGIAFPATAAPRVYSLAFVARVPRERLDDLADALHEGSPDFAFEQASGRVFPSATPEGDPLDGWFRAIRDRTVAVRVHGGDGQVLVWRVARKLEGQRLTIGQWAAAVNEQALQVYGRPFWLAEQGFLASLAGWDTGAWDCWWRLAGNGAPGADWDALRLKRDVGFVLHADPPDLSRREAERLAALSAHPVFLSLAGFRAARAGDDAAALACYQAAAAQQYAPALHRLGVALAEGRGVAASATQAVQCFEAAARQGYAPGLSELGRSHLRGSGVPLNRETAFAWLARAEAQGHPDGSTAHALCLIRGYGVAADAAQGTLAMRRAAHRGSATAQLALGLQLLDGGDPEGVDWLHCAAQGGNAKAQARFARCLSEGVNVPRNPEAAAHWYLQSARQGEAAAQLALGLALRSGVGTRRDPRQALIWLRRAAEQNNAEAQTWLGFMLLQTTGQRHAADREEGLAWVRRAAEAGFAQAQYLLGICLYAGYGGTTQAPAEALKWFLAAAGQQVLPARILAALCYYQGVGAPRDRAEAFRQFSVAAEQGSPVAQIWLAYCYVHGEGVGVDLKLARDWAQKAWRQGHPGGHQMLRKIPRE
jgi:TPR repeat protein